MYAEVQQDLYKHETQRQILPQMVDVFLYTKGQEEKRLTNTPPGELMPNGGWKSNIMMLYLVAMKLIFCRAALHCNIV